MRRLRIARECRQMIAILLDTKPCYGMSLNIGDVVKISETNCLNANTLSLFECKK